MTWNSFLNYRSNNKTPILIAICMSFIPQVLEQLNIRTTAIDANYAPCCGPSAGFDDNAKFLSAIKYGDTDPITVIFQADSVRTFFVARAIWPISNLSQSQHNDLDNFVNLANSKLIFGVFESLDEFLSLRFSCTYNLSCPLNTILPLLLNMNKTCQLLAKPIQTCLTMPNTFFVSLVYDQLISRAFGSDPFFSDYQKAFKAFGDDDSSDKSSSADPLKEAVKSLTKISMSNVSGTHKIGEGGFARIYCAEYIGTPIVIKQLKKSMSDDVKAIIANEVLVMANLRHPNIIQLIGIIDKPFSLIMEYMPKGNVDSVIRAEGKHLKLGLRLSMLCDAARGMAYLHNQNVSHGDLKPLNLFVGSDYKVKVGDFGLAVMTKGNDQTEVHGFTPAYAAPEYFRKISTKESDIYAFSSTIYFVITGKCPFNGRTPKEFKALIQTGKTPALKKSQFPSLLARLTQAGWNLDPKRRPPFKQFTYVLNKMCQGIPK